MISMLSSEGFIALFLATQTGQKNYIAQRSNYTLSNLCDTGKSAERWKPREHFFYFVSLCTKPFCERIVINLHYIKIKTIFEKIR